MDWNYISDGLPPKTKPDTLFMWLVSAKNKHGECYVTFATYTEGMWRDTDLREIEVYAWCKPVPATERA